MPGQLLRETNPAQGYGPALVPQHEDVNGDYKTTGEKNPLPVSVEDGGAAAQVDVQYRKQKMTQTHAAVSVLPAAVNNGAWIDTDGFDKIGVTAISGSAKAFRIYVHWSNDQSVIHGAEPSVAGTGYGSLRVETAARYARIALENSDAAAQTMSSWIYLKV